MKHLLSIVFAWLTLVSTAFAIDCSKATTELDQFTCGYAEMKKVDAEMAAANLRVTMRVASFWSRRGDR